MRESPDQISSRDLLIFYRISQSLVKAEDPSHLLDLIVEAAVEEFDAERASIFLRDEDTGRLRLVAGKGIPQEVISKKPLAEERSISYWVAKNKQPLILNGPVEGDPRFRSFSKGTFINSALVVPLIFEDTSIGVISVSRTKKGVTYTKKHLRILSILASQAAVAIEIARLQEKKLQAERLAAIGQAVAEISHSIRNLLSGFQGALTLLEFSIKKRDWKNLQEGWEILSHNIGHISHLVQDMLDFSRTKTLSRKRLNLNHLLEELLALIHQRCQTTGIKVVTHPGKGSLVIRGDREALHKAFLNIMENALEAMPKGGNFLLRWGKDSSGINARIEIKDTGIGIPRKNLKKIFEPFYTTKATQGTGLGLPISKKIIEEHGGKISVASAYRKGTSFTITLPLISST